MNKENQKCRVCGCTDTNPCRGYGCAWTEKDLFSNCALVDFAKKDLDLFLGYELGDYRIFAYDEEFEIEGSDEASVCIYVKFNEEKVTNGRFLMEKKEFDPEDTDFEEGLDVFGRWKVSVEVFNDNWEEIKIFDSSIKYLYIALLLR